MIEIKNLKKSYKEKPILKGVDLTIKTGELMVIIGSSGCGKTTLLKTINKLNSIDSGDILLDGISIKNIKETDLRKRIGYVIQEGGLFSHLSVEDNINLILKITNYPKDKYEERVIELLNMVNLDPNEYRYLYPCQLSGGQRQRVGVARAFAANPGIILMDEPFSALDPVTRSELQDEVVRLQKQYKKTIVFVTHDIDEAIKMANRICILEEGQIVQCDTPENILKHPADEYVEHFVGKKRIWGNPEYIHVHDIMKKHPICISHVRSVFQALQIMHNQAVDSVLVTDHGKLKGVVWLEDLDKIKDYNTPVSECVSKNITILHKSATLQNIIDTVDFNVSGIMPVIDDDCRVIGYLTKSIMLATLSRRYEKNNAIDEGSEIL